MGLQPSAPVAPCVLPTSPSDATTVGIPAREHLFGAEPSEGLPTPSPAIHFTISIVLSRCHRVALASHISHPELTISTLGGGAKRPAPAPRQYDNSVRPVPPQRQLLSRSCLFSPFNGIVPRSVAPGWCSRSSRRPADRAPLPNPGCQSSSLHRSVATVLIQGAPLVTVTLRIPVLQSHLTIASTHSSPAHVDFEYSDTLCGTAWRDDYIRLHSAIRRANAAAYIPIPPPSPPPPPSLRRLLSLVPTAAAAAVPDPNLSIRTLPDASIRFLTFDQAGHCGGFGEFLVGLVSSFVAALLDRRAFVIRHDCIQYAFEPAFIDWRPSPDVPMEPSRRTKNLNESFPPGVIPFLDLNGNRMGLQGLERFKAFRHVKVLWNRGMVMEMLTKGTGEWADAFRATGLRPPYAFGRILRFLVRPRKEVWPLVARLLQEMREVRTVVVGVHVRLSDSVVRDPHATTSSATPASMTAALEAAVLTLACAKAVEDMWYPPPLTVRWMLITNSIDLKTAIRSRFPGKILETDFVPRHSQAFGNKGKEQEREEAEQGYREMVAEWLLLSSCNSFVLPVSGFSLTAAMYSLHLMPLYTPHYCDPEQPHSQTDL
ncbi:unnamed protein product [Closterium sp. NIES-54]